VQCSVWWQEEEEFGSSGMSCETCQLSRGTDIRRWGKKKRQTNKIMSKHLYRKDPTTMQVYCGEARTG